MTESSPPTTAPMPAASNLPGIGSEVIIAIIGATVQLFLRSQVTVRKDELAWTLNSLARAIRQVEGDLAGQAHPAWAQYADLTVQHIEAAARYLHDHDYATILHDAEHLAKERPALVFGAMLGLGVLAGRFFKNTAPQATTHS